MWSRQPRFVHTPIRNTGVWLVVHVGKSVSSIYQEVFTKGECIMCPHWGERRVVALSGDSSNTFSWPRLSPSYDLVLYLSAWHQKTPGPSPSSRRVMEAGEREEECKQSWSGSQSQLRRLTFLQVDSGRVGEGPLCSGETWQMTRT